MSTSGTPHGRRPGAGALEYPVEVATMLWPSPAQVRLTRRPAPAAAAQWLVLPSASRPRLLVPGGVRAAALMLTRHGDRSGARAVRALLAAGVRTGVLERGPVLRLVVDAPPGAPSLERHLAPFLGDGIVLGALLGTPRVNRKPVLQVFHPAGRTVAFVKAAHDQRTRWLVRREADNLARVHSLGLDTVEPPEVRYAGSFGVLEVLVLSPLASSQQQGRAGVAPAPLEAMAELSRSVGLTRTALAESAYARRLSAWPAQGPTGQEARLRALVLAALDRYGAEEVELGAWHGDWAPWNMGWVDGRLQLWDWERYAEGVPLGFDLVHFLGQRVRHDRPELRAAEDALLAALPGLLPAVGVPAARTRQTLVLYLLELAGRFVLAEGGAAGSDHPRARWALDLTARLLASADTRSEDVRA